MSNRTVVGSFEAPGPKRSTRDIESMYAEVTETAMKHPGQWILLFEDSKNNVAPKPFQGPKWERAYRKIGKLHRTYIMYRGEDA